MSNYEFGGRLYPNLGQMLNAIVTAWLDEASANDDDYITDTLATWSDRELADECIDSWRFDQPWKDGEPSDMQRYDYTTNDLAEAFGRYRRTRR